MKPRLEFKKSPAGRGVRLVVNDGWPCAHGISYMDAAKALFDLKDFLQASDTGRRCLDSVHKNREAARRAAE